MIAEDKFGGYWGLIVTILFSTQFDRFIKFNFNTFIPENIPSRTPSFHSELPNFTYLEADINTSPNQSGQTQLLSLFMLIKNLIIQRYSESSVKLNFIGFYIPRAVITLMRTRPKIKFTSSLRIKTTHYKISPIIKTIASAETRYTGCSKKK